MRRKIIRQGHDTMTLSLPKKWCENHKLKSGDEVEVEEKGINLLISKEAFKGAGSTTVDVTGLDRSTIMLLIQSLYTYGYDSMEIKTSDSKVKWHWGNREIGMPVLINQSINRLIGAELVSSSKASYRIQVIAGELKESFDIVLKRIFLLTQDLFETFMERYRKSDFHIIEQIELQYLQLRRFMNYSLRLLNKFGYEDASKTTFYFGIIKSFSRIVESLKNISGPMEKPMKVSRKACDIMQEVKEAYDEYYNLFYKYSIDKVSGIVKRRDIFKRKVYYEEFKKLDREDVSLLSSMEQVMDSIIDLSELKMAIEHKE